MDMNKKSKLGFVDENQFSGSINYSFPLSKISWLKVGGPVDILFRPKNLDDLSRFLSLIAGTNKYGVIILISKPPLSLVYI